mmetsp:Transcript_31128/g.98789  ORF Transcript_31128/g.98789 Transcript_31128/m.98789 type:complete len:245 (+) Transcript_31128:1312-2046(+)
MRRVLEEQGDALATADAGRADGVLLVLADELVREVRRDARAGGAERVADGDGAAVGVGDLPVEAQLLLAGEVLRREGLVDFHDVDLVERHARGREYAADGLHRADAHGERVATDAIPGDDARERSHALGSAGLLRGDDERGGAVADARGRTGRDAAVLLEHWRQLGHGGDVGLAPARVLVGADGLHGALHLDLDGRDLRLEDAGVGGVGVGELRAHGVLVALLARDAVLVREVLGRDAHGRPRE